jgi:hypothetical protein
MSERSHRRLTPSRRYLLAVIRSFGPAGATEREIRLRARRLRARRAGQRR